MIPERKPSSVGEILREEYFKPLNISQREFAQLCGIANPATMEWLLHDSIYFRRTHAEKLAHGTGTTPEFWMNLNTAWRNWHLKLIQSKIRGTHLPDWARSVYIYDGNIVASDGIPGNEKHWQTLYSGVTVPVGTVLSLCFGVVDGRVVNE